MNFLKKPILWSERIPFIKNLKGFYSEISHRGINFWPIIAGDVYTYYKNQEHRTWVEKILMITKNLFLKDKYQVHGKKGKILVSYFMPRKDHHELVMKAIERFPKEELIMLDCYKYKQKNPLLRSSFRFPDFILLFNIWNRFRKVKLKKVLGKNYYLFLTKTYLIHKRIDQFYKIYNKYNPRAHIAFCSQAFEEDAILTLIHKKEGKPTFTLQHGFILTNSPYFSPHIIQIENLISDYFLIWGNSMHKSLKEYVDEKNLLIAGNPKHSNKDIKKIKKFSPKIATFFFSTPGYEKSNEKVIKILNKFAEKHSEIKFNLKIHPFDDVKNYMPLISTKNIQFTEKEYPIQKLLEKSDFIILHNTSIAYEALLYKTPIFRFEDEFIAKVWEFKDTFRNPEELEKLFNKLKDKNYFNGIMKFYDKKLKEMFYLHPTKETSQIYYEKIIGAIRKYNLN